MNRQVILVLAICALGCGTGTEEQTGPQPIDLTGCWSLGPSIFKGAHARSLDAICMTQNGTELEGFRLTGALTSAVESAAIELKQTFDDAGNYVRFSGNVDCPLEPYGHYRVCAMHLYWTEYEAGVPIQQSGVVSTTPNRYRPRGHLSLHGNCAGTPIDLEAHAPLYEAAWGSDYRNPNTLTLSHLDVGQRLALTILNPARVVPGSLKVVESPAADGEVAVALEWEVLAGGGLARNVAVAGTVTMQSVDPATGTFELECAGGGTVSGSVSDAVWP